MVIAEFPDFSPHGYTAIRELGRNATGGRVVYLCQVVTDRSQQAVIKQFQFAKGSGWSQFKEIEREMQVLRDLQHTGIPHYIGSFQTDDGYAIVQEFKDAPALSIPRSFDPDQIKHIAVAVLEILIYLQNRIPVIIHRDIKPENVLVDEQLNVYLIDFGFARIGGGEVAMSSVAAGTFGFMAPEQMYNKGLTAATDLYGLGAMLIALLTQTKSTRMDTLIADDGKITFQHLTPKLSLRFVEWLGKMVAPRTSDRYNDAESALSALKPIYVVRYPSVEFSQPSLQFRATQLGEKITQTITIINPTPDTQLEGNWSIEPHPHDPPHAIDRHHKWISFSSRSVSGNLVECEITVDTSKLISQAIGTRSIVLRSNAVPDTHTLALQVITAPLPIQVKQLPYTAISIFSTFAIACGLSINNGTCWSGAETGMPAGCLSSIAVMIFANFFTAYNANVEQKIYVSTVVGAIFGYWSGGLAGGLAGGTVGGWVGSIAGGISIAGIEGVMFGSTAMIGGMCTSIFGFLAGSMANYPLAGLLVGGILGIQAGTISTIFEIRYARVPASRKYPPGFIFRVLAIVPFLAISLGVSLAHPNLFLLAIAAIAIARLVYVLIYLPSQSTQQMKAYRHKEKYLIKL